MDFWTHNKTMFIFSEVKWYMYIYVLNQWTQGLSDTLQKTYPC